MNTKLRVAFFGDMNSAHSRLDYAVLRKYADVLVWVENKSSGGNPAQQRRAFFSAREWWQRLRMRIGLECRSLFYLGIPFLLEKRIEAPVLFVSRNDGYGLQALQDMKPDLIFAGGFPRILPDAILQTAKLGAYNCHPSPLPRYAGADPWFWMLCNGETQSAVTIHKMVAGIDAGNIVVQRFFPIKRSLNHRAFYNRSIVESAMLLKDCIIMWSKGRFPETPQDMSQRTIFRAPSKADYQIDWTETGRQIQDLVRASNPSPGAWAIAQNRRFIIRGMRYIKGSVADAGTVVSINGDGVSVACADGIVQLLCVAQETNEIRGRKIGELLGLSIGDIVCKPDLLGSEKINADVEL
jgi:methionyl-tRNA formyltransferase